MAAAYYDIGTAGECITILAKNVLFISAPISGLAQRTHRARMRSRHYFACRTILILSSPTNCSVQLMSNLTLVFKTS